jgi:hypothetical protein
MLFMSMIFMIIEISMTMMIVIITMMIVVSI